MLLDYFKYQSLSGQRLERLQAVEAHIAVWVYRPQLHVGLTVVSVALGRWCLQADMLAAGTWHSLVRFT